MTTAFSFIRKKLTLIWRAVRRDIGSKHALLFDGDLAFISDFVITAKYHRIFNHAKLSAKPTDLAAMKTDKDKALLLAIAYCPLSSHFCIGPDLPKPDSDTQDNYRDQNIA
jgi:hypothetical protein